MTTQTKTTWKKVKLGDVAEIESGGTPSSSKPEYWDNGDICWATLPDLKNKYIFDTQRKITALGLKNSSAKLLPIDSVIFSSRATIGEISITKVETSTNQGSKNFICDPKKIEYEFLYYLLKSKVDEIIGLATGATYKEINKTVFSSIEIDIPNLLTQKQIADVLSAYDDLIENNTKRIKILEEIAQAIYKEWFVYFRFPGHEKAKSRSERSSATGIKMIDSKTEFGKIPEGWEVKKIKDVFDVKYGKNLPTSKIEDAGKYPVYGAGGVIGFYDEQNSNGKVALITCRGNGSGTVWRTRGLGFVTNNSFVVRQKEEYGHVSFETIYFALKEANVDSAISGSAQPQITIESLNFVNVLLPEENLLKSFQHIIKTNFDLIDSLFIENQNLCKARDLLLPKLVSGEIRV